MIALSPLMKPGHGSCTEESCQIWKKPENDATAPSTPTDTRDALSQRMPSSRRSRLRTSKSSECSSRNLLVPTAKPHGQSTDPLPLERAETEVSECP